MGSHLHERLAAAGRGSGSEADWHIGRQRLGSRGGLIVGIFKLMQDSEFCTYCSVGTGNWLGGGERAFRRVGFIAAVIAAKGGDFGRTVGFMAALIAAKGWDFGRTVGFIAAVIAAHGGDFGVALA